MKKKVGRQIMILIMGPIMGLIALLCVYYLPVTRMKENIYWSLDTITAEFDNEIQIAGFPATLTGNFTDCLMLEHAVYNDESHSILEQILHMYRGESFYNVDCQDVWHPGESLKDYLSGGNQPREVEYARYWHGYLILLKPLLFLTSVNTIRLMNAGLQLTMVGVCIILMVKRGNEDLAYAFVGSVPFLYFVSTYASLSQSICLFLMLIAVIILLLFNVFLWKRSLFGEYFLIVGMATSYFDFLTYPLITLGFPLCIFLALYGTELKNKYWSMIQMTLEWIVGYLGMWVSKWILVDFLSGGNTMEDAMSTIMVRAGSAGGYKRMEGFSQVVYLNLNPYANWAFFILFIVLIASIVVRKFKSKIKILRIYEGIPYIILGLYPFGWWFFALNHSFEHWMFTCKIISISVFAMQVGVQAMIGEKPR